MFSRWRRLPLTSQANRRSHQVKVSENHHGAKNMHKQINWRKHREHNAKMCPGEHFEHYEHSKHQIMCRWTLTGYSSCTSPTRIRPAMRCSSFTLLIINSLTLGWSSPPPSAACSIYHPYDVFVAGWGSGVCLDPALSDQHQGRAGQAARGPVVQGRAWKFFPETFLFQWKHVSFIVFTLVESQTVSWYIWLDSMWFHEWGKQNRTLSDTKKLIKCSFMGSTFVFNQTASWGKDLVTVITWNRYSF